MGEVEDGGDEWVKHEADRQRQQSPIIHSILVWRLQKCNILIVIIPTVASSETGGQYFLLQMSALQIMNDSNAVKLNRNN